MNLSAQSGDRDLPGLLASMASASPFCLLLVGLPGSGKSTLAAQLMQQGTFRLVSTDRIRSQLFGDEAIQGSWLRIWREVGNQFRQSVHQTADGNLIGAIYDATNVVRKQRRQAIMLARRAGFKRVVGVWLNPSLEICFIRNQQRDRQVPEAVMLRMHRRLYAAPPAVIDGFDALVEIQNAGSTGISPIGGP